MIDQLDQLTLFAHTWEMKLSAKAKPAPKKYGKPLRKPYQVNIYEAKTQLSSLVERAAKGEEIVIAKAGKPMARLTVVSESAASKKSGSRRFGKNLMGITYIADDFDAPLPEDVLRDFGL
jgi:prevent-host-death family protein